MEGGKLIGCGKSAGPIKIRLLRPGILYKLKYQRDLDNTVWSYNHSQPSQIEYSAVSSQYFWHPGFLGRRPDGWELTARFVTRSSRRVWTF